MMEVEEFGNKIHTNEKLLQKVLFLYKNSLLHKGYK
jgi:hypothetical protein